MQKMFLLALLFVFSACSPAQTLTPSSSPTTTTITITHTVDLKPNETVFLKKNDAVWIKFANVLEDKLVGVSVEVIEASDEKWIGWWNPIAWAWAPKTYNGDAFHFSLKGDVITITYPDSWKLEGGP